MEEIKKLIDTLSKLGYSSYRINNFVISCVGNNNLKTLTFEQREKLQKSLEEQVKFAEKCLKAIY